MNLNTLVYFLEIVEAGSLNKAAQNLYISQPALRSAISNLEKELGAPLLNRTKHGSSLTNFGQKVALEAPAILRYISDWKKYASIQNITIEEIEIYATKPFCNIILMPITVILQQKYPHFKFLINSASCSTSLNMLSKTNCQLAIIHTDLDTVENTRRRLQIYDKYEIEKIFESSFLALINKSNTLNQQASLQVNDFNNLIYTNVSTLEMSSQIDALKIGLIQNKSQTLFCDSHHSIYQVVNENPNYYSLLSDIFTLTNTYQMYTNACLKPISDFSYKSAFYLIHPKFDPSSNLNTVCEAIKNYCTDITSTIKEPN